MIAWSAFRNSLYALVLLCLCGAGPSRAEEHEDTEADKIPTEATITIPVLCIHGESRHVVEEGPFEAPVSGIKASDHSSFEILKRIMDFVGLRRDIEVEDFKDFENACAEIGNDQKRKIYVDEVWIDQFARDEYWIKFFLLSHELGHHLNAHALASEESESWQKEVDADWFAGRVYKLASGNAKALGLFFEECPFIEDKTHPPCFLRRATVDQVLDGVYEVAPPPSFDVTKPQADPSERYGREVQQDALARILDSISGIQIDAVDENMQYDAVVQAGHFGRKSGGIGSRGMLVSEQELAAYIANQTVQRLRERGLNAILVGGHRTFGGRPETKVFL